LMFSVSVSVAASGCARIPSASVGVTGSPVLFSETFDTQERIQRDWVAVGSQNVDANLFLDNGALRLVLPSAGEIGLSRLLDSTAMRARRVQVSARLRADSATAHARVSMSISSRAGYHAEQLREPSTTLQQWSQFSAIVDVDPSAQQIELSLVLRGTGSAWFDDVKVEVLRTAPAPTAITLSPRQLANVEALTRAATLVRYRHPADQSATLDWDAFLPRAIDLVMQAKTKQELLGILSDLFKPIAPTVEFSESPIYSLGEPPHEVSTHYLSRWQHLGLGPESPYSSWREGLDRDLASLRFETALDASNLSICRKALLTAMGHRLDGDGEVVVYADIGQPGMDSKEIELKLDPSESTTSIGIDMPMNSFDLRLGVKLAGRTGVTLGALSLTCDNHVPYAVDFSRATWSRRGTEALYTYDIRDCAPGACLTIQRKPVETKFVSKRDVLDREIAERLWIHVPLAVWSDGQRTLPDVPPWKSTAVYGPTDAPMRLAIVASAWGTLSLFYPYFAEQNTDWSLELPRGLTSMAAARSTAEIYFALASVLAALHDNHARAFHPTVPSRGMLPIALRNLGQKVVVVGGLDGYLHRIPIGSEIVALDSTPMMQLYSEMLQRTSVATTGWSDTIVPFWLTVGPVGVLSTVTFKTASGAVSSLLVPHVPRDQYESSVREPRPTFGAELTSGVYYVDLDGMKNERWQSLLPTLSNARAIIMDMRGYPSSAVFGILGHFSSRDILSPHWEVPLLGTDSYRETSWKIRPVLPRLNATAILLVDGRAISAAETVIQIVRDNHLATLVGETSGGTNGNMNVVELPAEFSMRFTGMRVPLADGRALQGRGITPDLIIHPTLEGVRAGRDEILEAALAFVNK